MAKRKEQDEAHGVRAEDEQAYFGAAYRDDIVQNQQGRLTARQYARVVRWDYKMPIDEAEQVRVALKQERARQPLRVAYCVALGLLMLPFALAPVRDQDDLLGRLLIVIVPWVAAYWNYRRQPLTPLEYQRRFKEEEEMRRERLIYRTSTRKLIRVEGIPDYATRYEIRIDGVTYRAKGWLYRWLRENSKRVAVYAIEGWYPQHALSVEPLDVPIPMTPEERLQTVVGVSSEGELVYADDPQQDDARPIENT